MGTLRVLLLLGSALLYGSVECQGPEMSPVGSLCYTSVVRGATFKKNEEIWRTFVYKLMGGTTFTKQKSIVKTFMGNKWKQMGYTTKAAATARLPSINTWLKSRNRMVNYYKGLLAKLKAKLPTNIAAQARYLLWGVDRSHMNDVNRYFPTLWQGFCFGMFINKTADQQTFTKVVNNYRAEYDQKNPGVFDADAKLSAVAEACYS